MIMYWSQTERSSVFVEAQTSQRQKEDGTFFHSSNRTTAIKGETKRNSRAYVFIPSLENASVTYFNERVARYQAGTGRL
jgi:hypothetical protein